VAGVARSLAAEEAAPGRTAQIAALFTKLQSLSPEERDALRRRKAGSDESSGS
jgi:hypothetical protein